MTSSCTNADPVYSWLGSVTTRCRQVKADSLFQRHHDLEKLVRESRARNTLQ